MVRFNLSLTVTALSLLRAAVALWQDVSLNFIDLTSTFQGPSFWQLSVNLLLFCSEPCYSITTIPWTLIWKEYWAVKYLRHLRYGLLLYHSVREMNNWAHKKLLLDDYKWIKEVNHPFHLLNSAKKCVREFRLRKFTKNAFCFLCWCFVKDDIIDATLVSWFSLESKTLLFPAYVVNKLYRTWCYQRQCYSVDIHNPWYSQRNIVYNPI